MNKVSSANWERVKEIFETVLARPFAERDAYLDQVCAGDDAVRGEVESLLKSYEQAESFMETPAVHSAAETLIENEHRLIVGQKLDHYEILEAIGEGGMGEVYLARDTTLGRRVALKLLPAYFTSDAERLRRFQQEARAASTLNNPNVCIIHEVGEAEDGRPFITMEYVEGSTLRQRLDNGPFSLADSLNTSIQIADALVAAHDAGIVHRDIKPENIMLRRDGYVKVLDFGLAKLTEKSTAFNSETATTLMRTSTPGLIMGTVAYMSPEQARGLTVDARTDIWSLGVVLYEMISGQAPFQGETPTDVVVAIVEKDQPSLGEFIDEMPAELERIVRKALRKDRDERYQLAKEVAIDLRSLRRELQIESDLGRSAVPELARDGRRAKAVQSTRQLGAHRTTATASFSELVAKPRSVAVILFALLIFSAIGYVGYKAWQKFSPAPASQRFQRINVTKLTTNGNAWFAAISQDGKYVAYVMNEGGLQSLWLRQVAVESNARLIAPREGRYLGLAFSSDGNHIFYGYLGAETKHQPELYKMPILATGTSAVRISIYVGPPSPSHDGKKIAFFRYDEERGEDRLAVANVDGSDEQVVAIRKWPERLGGTWEARPIWSADDQVLTFVLVSTKASTFVFELHELRLSNHAESVIPLSDKKFELLDGVTLMADARGVLTTAKAQGASFFQVWEVLRDGSARQITNDLSDYVGISVTNDTKSVVTIQRQVLSNLSMAPKGQTTKLAPVTSGAGRYFDITWSPDDKIIYASDASGSANIYQMEPDGSSFRALTDVGRNYAPAVSRDNRYIAFHSNRSGIFQIWRMDRDGSNPKQLTFDTIESNWPQFSADGKWIVFQHFDLAAPGSVWRVPVDGGTPEKISEASCVRPTISPDGNWIGCWSREPNGPFDLAVLPFKGDGPARTFKVPPTVEVSWDTPLRWAADGRSLTYVDHRGGFDNLWGQAIAGGAPKQITDFKDSRIFSIDWSRDGRLLASRGVQTNDVVLISEAK